MNDMEILAKMSNQNKDIRASTALLEIRRTRQGGIAAFGIDPETVNRLGRSAAEVGPNYVCMMLVINKDQFDEVKQQEQQKEAIGGIMPWSRHRFCTTADDVRPVKFDDTCPWWISGTGGHETLEGEQGWHTTIVAYLPASENLKDYWPEAFNVSTEPCPCITYTDRFPKPDWIKD